MDIGDGAEATPYPAPAKQAAGLVNGSQTDVSSVYFADKILITISQGGRISQWVCKPSKLFIVCMDWYANILIYRSMYLSPRPPQH